ncbi:MAG: hypothetical protein BroJett011_63040 [Chloroflexota bacterium]|nr:MAG: hypothetical protein BroJett011_63040 [Chloroflexota bacterium]
MELVFVVAEDDMSWHMDLFLRVKRAARQPRTVEWYEAALRSFQDVAGGEWPPGPAHLLAFLETFEIRKLSDASRNTYFRAVRAWLNWLYRNRFIQHNPLDFIDGPGAARLLPKAPPPADVARLLATVEARADSWQDWRDLALFSLALDTGARIGELAAMDLGDIDLGQQEIMVYGAKDRTERVVEFDDSAARDLGRWLRQRAALKPARTLRRLFLSNYRAMGLRPLTHWGMRLRLKFWQMRAGIAPFRFHGFRHAYAIYSLRNNANLLDIKDQMGHASIKTTAIYLEVVNNNRKERHRQTSPRKNLPRIDGEQTLC